MDAFQADWPSSGLLYAFPPVSVMTRFLQRVRELRPRRLLLIASMSPMRAFHPDLLSMSRRDPIPVCRSPGSLWQLLAREESPRFHYQPELFTLGAWLLEHPQPL